MAWTNLPTNFKNLIWSGLKKYRQYTNQDNTVSFEDVTEYDDTDGTQMSASQLNQMTGAINKLMTDIAAEFSSSISYAVDDYCMYNDQLYRFITTHPAGDWNSEHVTAVSKITNEITRKLSDAPSDNKNYARKNGAWSEVTGGGGGGSWGSITGTLSDQTDLQSALNAKQNTLTFDTTPTASSTNPVTSGGIKTELDKKADTANVVLALEGKADTQNAILTGVPVAPTAAVGTNSTQIATTAFVVSHDVFKITGTVSASNYTLTDSRINDNHWEVDQIYFATPSNVTSQVHWTTDITNHQVSLSATYAGSTNVVVKMHWVQ